MQHRTLIAMLGSPAGGEYQETRYQIDRWISEPTRFSFYPHIKKLQPDQVYLFGSNDSIWESLPGDLEYDKVEISLGRDANEQWSIFEEFVKLDLRSDHITFDLTHGFRSMPFLALLGMIYFKEMNKDIHIQHVFYGAYENRDREHNITPVIDLAPFLEIIDWLYASKIFLTHGDGMGLAKLLSNEQQFLGLVDGLEQTAIATRMNYVIEAIDGLEKTHKALKKCKNLPLPFKLVERRVDKLPEIILKHKYAWRRQHEMARWFLENRQPANSIITLRESIITYFAECINASDRSYKNRNQIAKVIPKILNRYGFSDLRSLYGEVTSLRNSAGHSKLDSHRTSDMVNDLTLLEKLVKDSTDFMNRDQNSANWGLIRKQIIEGGHDIEWLNLDSEIDIESLRSHFG